jgi:hypothetical protein
MNKKTDLMLAKILGENFEQRKNQSDLFGIYQENGKYFLCSIKNILYRLDYVVFRKDLYSFLTSQGYDNNIAREVVKSANSGNRVTLNIDSVVIGRKVLKNTKRAKISKHYQDKNSKWITQYERELQIPKNEDAIILKPIKNKTDDSYTFEIDVNSIKSEKQTLKYVMMKSKKQRSTHREKFNVNNAPGIFPKG